MKNILQASLVIIFFLSIIPVIGQPPPVAPTTTCRMQNVIVYNITSHSADITWTPVETSPFYLYRLWLYHHSDTDSSLIFFPDYFTSDTVIHITGLEENTSYMWKISRYYGIVLYQEGVQDCFSEFQIFKTFPDSIPLSAANNPNLNSKLDFIVLPTIKEKEINVSINNNKYRADITICNLLGQKVYNTFIIGQGRQNKIIALNGNEKGIYLINVRNSNSSKTLRVVF